MNQKPPVWADKFLSWYCDPRFLEEIQGDAHELYKERIQSDGKFIANIRYVWDVIRFFRPSNVKAVKFFSTETTDYWKFPLKMSVRRAQKQKAMFGIKILTLSMCLAFALLLTSFIRNELSFDKSNKLKDRIYRISLQTKFNDQEVDYAVTPIPLAEALREAIPEIESTTRFMAEDKPRLIVDGQPFYNMTVFSADSNFFKLLRPELYPEDPKALCGPGKIIITKSLARKLFGEIGAVGKDIGFGKEQHLRVTAVIDDLPSNSHLQYQALISWETFDRNSNWANINAYSYVLIKKGASISTVRRKVPLVMESYNPLITREFEAKVNIGFQNLLNIHFDQTLTEDIATKGSRDGLFFLAILIILFIATAVLNYLNLALAEHTLDVKRSMIMRVFGGVKQGSRHILVSDTLLIIAVVMPITIVLTILGSKAAESILKIKIEQDSLWSSSGLLLICLFSVLLISTTFFNGYILSKMEGFGNAVNRGINSAYSVRQFLVAIQLSFSIVMIALVVVVSDQFSYIQESQTNGSTRTTLAIRLTSNENDKVDAFCDEVRKIAGVDKSGHSSFYPGVIETKYVFEIETDGSTQQRLISMMTCNKDYFDAVGIKVKQGRSFESGSASDTEHGIIINEAAVKSFGWNSPIGKKISGPVDGYDGSSREGEVIGVAKDFNFMSLHNKVDPMIIFLADDYWTSQYVYVKLNPIYNAGVLESIGNEFHRFWPDDPYDWEDLESKYIRLYRTDFETKNLLRIALVISILTSAIGIFSISALISESRQKEMGIRKVSGAAAITLFVLHIRSFVRYVLVAILVAVPILWFVSQNWLIRFAYHINVSPRHFLIPSVFAVVLTLSAAFYHGLKAAFVNPIKSLKHE